MTATLSLAADLVESVAAQSRTAAEALRAEVDRRLIECLAGMGAAS